MRQDSQGLPELLCIKSQDSPENTTLKKKQTCIFRKHQNVELKSYHSDSDMAVLTNLPQKGKWASKTLECISGIFHNGESNDYWYFSSVKVSDKLQANISIENKLAKLKKKEQYIVYLRQNVNQGIFHRSNLLCLLGNWGEGAILLKKKLKADLRKLYTLPRVKVYTSTSFKNL